MTTKGIIQGYFDSLKKKSSWETFLADGMTFTSFVTPIKQTAGKSAYLESTRRFFSMITAVEVKDLICRWRQSMCLDAIRSPASRGAGNRKPRRRGVHGKRRKDLVSSNLL